jgi:hypothetical protein
MSRRKGEAMKRILIIGLVASLSVIAALAQSSSSTAQKTLASSINVYAYPQKGQSASVQSQNEADCYQWSVMRTGNDPFELEKQMQAQAAATAQGAQQAAASPSGRTVGREAVKGAAVGTLIGGISGNEGKGAAYGAAFGLIRGARRSNAEAQQNAQAVQSHGNQQQAATAAQVDDFKKAFSVCLEGKGYMVKY